MQHMYMASMGVDMKEKCTYIFLKFLRTCLIEFVCTTVALWLATRVAKVAVCTNQELAVPYLCGTC